MTADAAAAKATIATAAAGTATGAGTATAAAGAGTATGAGTAATAGASRGARHNDGPLGPRVLVVLTAASRKIEQLLPGVTTDLRALQANPGAVNQLLDWLVKPAAGPLRAASRAALTVTTAAEPADGQAARAGLVPLTSLTADTLARPHPTYGLTLTATADAALAVALTSEDLGDVATAAGMLRQHVDDARRARRQARRHGDAPSVEQRAAERDRARLEHLRDQVARARARTATLETEKAALKGQVDDLLGNVSTLQRRLQVAEQRLAAARADAGSPQQLAGTLASVLRRALTVTPMIDPTDPQHRRTVHPAEAGPLPDPRQAAAAAEAARLAAQLTTAAELAGLPRVLAEQATAWLPNLLAGLTTSAVPVRVSPERGLTLDVLGGGTEVGGSCVLVTGGDTRLLIDVGSRPGGIDAESLAPRRIGEALSRRLDAIVVTHAHNDHAGWVPAVVAAQPHVPVLVTDATAALLATMWEDSAKVLNRRAREISNEGDAAPLPPYTRDDVRRALARLRVVDVGVRQRVGQLHLELFPAGHIVGAVGVVVHAGSQRAVISGDVSGPGQLTVGGIAIPASARDADLLVLETTYAGTAKLAPRDLVVRNFLGDVAQTVSAGGTVLVPAFALGRAQEVALMLAKHLPEIEVLVDGLARDVCEIYAGQIGPGGERLNVFGGRVRPVPRGQTPSQMVPLRPGVVIATSGMLHGGPSVAWARKILPDPRHRLMLVGYQDPGSPGKQLSDLVAAGGGVIELPNAEGLYETVPVNASVGSYQLGAHAGADDLVDITSQVRPRELMLVHGDLGAQRKFAERMKLRRQATLLAERPWKRLVEQGRQELAGAVGPGDR